MEFHTKNLAITTRHMVDWWGSQHRLANSLAIREGAIRLWLRGKTVRISKLNRARIEVGYERMVKKRKQIIGLASYYADAIFKSADLDPEMSKKDVMARVLQCKISCTNRRADIYTLSYSDFLHDRKRFACVVAANIMPEKSKREIWEIVKKAIPNIEKT